jgi:hypothetical protein
MNGETRNTYKVLVIKIEEKKTFGRSRCRWEDNIYIDLEEIRWEVLDWIHMAQDRVKWRAFVKMVMNLLVPQKMKIFVAR